jgi:hypothetical protein
MPEIEWDRIADLGRAQGANTLPLAAIAVLVSRIDVPDYRLEKGDARKLVVIDLSLNRGIGVLREWQRKRPMVALGDAQEARTGKDRLFRHHLAVLVG